MINEQLGKSVDAVVAFIGAAKSMDELKDIVNSMDMNGTLEKLKIGGDRVVYAIDADHVLKVERHSESGATPRQTEREVSPNVREVLRDYMPRTYESHPQSWWSVIERVQPIKGTQYKSWLAAAGITDTKLSSRSLGELVNLSLGFGETLRYFEALWPPSVVEKLVGELRGNELISRLAELRDVHKVGLWDLASKNLGFGVDGRPVILDLGVPAPPKKWTVESVITSVVRSVLSENFSSGVRVVVGRLKKVKKGSFSELASAIDELKSSGVIVHLDLVPGSHSRAVFNIKGGEFILKANLASDSYDQTESESRPELRAILREYMPRVIASDGLDWMVVEKVTPLENSMNAVVEWAAASAIPAELVTKSEAGGGRRVYALNIPKYIRALEYWEAWTRSGRIHSEETGEDFWNQMMGLSKEKSLDLLSNSLIQKLIEVKENLGVGLWDLRSDNLGWSSEGAPVIIDLGV